MNRDPDHPENSFPRDRKTRVHTTVFGVSSLLIVSFVLLSLMFQDDANALFKETRNAITHWTGWFFILAANLFLGVCVYFIFSKHGRIRLGGKSAKPEFGYLTWLAMLFSAGMGIGLIFWSVAEPLYHLATPPLEGIEPNSARAANFAMAVTFFHWGLHAWGIYALMGMALAYFAYNKGMPLTIRSTLHPILGDKIDGFWGNLVDIVASVATLFGVATSLGLGAQQVNAGLSHVFGLEYSSFAQICLIAGITLMATISVVSGLDKGIRRLSEANMLLALGLLLFVLVCGPTVFILKGLVQNIGAYAHHFVFLSSWTDTYQVGSHWRESWTVFYWAWWIAWSPFVGMFIARISRGRTLREFTLTVLLVPTVLTFAWLSVFGNAGLYETLSGNPSVFNTVTVNYDEAKSLFVLLENFPLSSVVSLLSIVVIVLFFVTSSDSGSLVIDTITAGGHTNPPTGQRIFWATMEGVVAAVLLTVGGEQSLKALQTASVATGLPFAIILVVIGYCLLRDITKPTRPSGC